MTEPTITILSFDPLQMQLPSAPAAFAIVVVRLPPVHLKLFDLSLGGIIPDGPHIGTELPMADIVITLVLVFSSWVVSPADFWRTHESLPTTLWATNAVISAALLWGPVAGVAVALPVALACNAVSDALFASVFRDAPAAFLKMIVVHELAHLKEFEHNKAFYQLCTHMVPDYHQLEFDLRLYLTHLEAKPA